MAQLEAVGPEPAGPATLAEGRPGHRGMGAGIVDPEWFMILFSFASRARTLLRPPGCGGQAAVPVHGVRSRRRRSERHHRKWVRHWPSIPASPASANRSVPVIPRHLRPACRSPGKERPCRSDPDRTPSCPQGAGARSSPAARTGTSCSQRTTAERIRGAHHHLGLQATSGPLLAGPLARGIRAAGRRPKSRIGIRESGYP